MATKISFEDRLKELQQTVAALENGDIPLDDALKKFHSGISDANKLQHTLNTAQKAITKEINSQGNEVSFNRDNGKTNTIPSQTSESNVSPSNDNSPFKN